MGDESVSGFLRRSSWSHEPALDRAIDEVESLMGPFQETAASRADDYLASFHPGHPLEKFGEFRLVERVFQDGLMLIAEAARGRSRTRESHLRKFNRLEPIERLDILKALVWLLTKDDPYIYGFDNLAHILDIDPDRMRARIYRLIGMEPSEIGAFVRVAAPLTWADLPGRGRARPRRRRKRT